LERYEANSSGGRGWRTSANNPVSTAVDAVWKICLSLDLEAKIRYTNWMAVIDPQMLAGLDGEALLASLQREAVTHRISDIHISPDRDTIRVEWREFGVLVHLVDITRDVYDAMSRRIKFSAKLKMNVSTVPQDGQYTFPFEDRSINVRNAADQIRRSDHTASAGSKKGNRSADRTWIS
jgi:hypothetical protein